MLSSLVGKQAEIVADRCSDETASETRHSEKFLIGASYLKR
jgi:hypothetical protein